MGRVAMGNEDFESAFRSFKSAGDGFLSSGQNDEAAKAYGFAGVTACCYRNAIEEGLPLLRRATELGYADLDKLEMVGKQIFQGNPVKHLKEFKDVQSLMIRKAEALKVLEWNNPTLGDWHWMNFPKPDDPRLAEFKAQTATLTSGDEMADIRQSLEWLHTHYRHGAVQGAETLELVAILKCAGKKEINCIEMAALFAALLQANGYYARRIASLETNYHYGSGQGHWLAEVWSDSFNKWIAVDAQNACLWKRGAEYLNACELAQSVRGGEKEKIEPEAVSDDAHELKSWLDHFQVIWIYRNQNLFEDCHHLSEVEECGPTPKLLFQGKPRTRFGHHSLPDGLYPAMNKVHYEVRIQETKLEFQLNHSMPFWLRYEYSVNDRNWKSCKSLLKTDLPKGKTKYTFRGAGLNERKSPPAEIMLET